MGGDIICKDCSSFIICGLPRNEQRWRTEDVFYSLIWFLIVLLWPNHPLHPCLVWNKIQFRVHQIFVAFYVQNKKWRRKGFSEWDTSSELSGSWRKRGCIFSFLFFCQIWDWSCKNKEMNFRKSETDMVQKFTRTNRSHHRRVICNKGYRQRDKRTVLDILHPSSSCCKDKAYFPDYHLCVNVNHHSWFWI